MKRTVAWTVALAFFLTACQPTAIPTGELPSTGGRTLLERVTVQQPELSTVTAAEAPRYGANGTATYRMPALTAPAHIRRSEGWWRVSQLLREGDLLVYEADLTATLGREALDGKLWHVMAQLHGPTTSRTGEPCHEVPAACWFSPPVSLGVSGGEWRVSGGYGAPRGPNAKIYPISAFKSGERIRVRLEILLSRDPSVGTVNVWWNGTHRLKDARMPAGTLYADQDAAKMGLKSGLYAGNNLSEFKEVVAIGARLSVYRRP